MDQKMNLKEPKQILGLALTDGMLLELLEKKEVDDTIIHVLGGEKIRYSCNLYIEIKKISNLPNAPMAKCRENSELFDSKDDNLKRFRSKAEKRAKELQDMLQENLKNKRKSFFLTSLDPYSLEFLDIQDKVNESNLMVDNLQQSVIQIEKITNFMLEEAYEYAKSQSFGSRGK